jgi:hypothetical protein
MSYIIPKDEMPQGQYSTLNVGDTIVMMTTIANGMVFMFPDEVLFVPWSEIATYATTSTKVPIHEEKEPEKPIPKSPVREVKK